MRLGPDQHRYNGNRRFQQQQRGLQHQTLDSNAAGLKIRGSARQIFERYIALAREAAAGGDRIAAENFYQHAEHYFRVDNDSRAPRPIPPADAAISGPEQNLGETGMERSQSGWGDDRPGSP